MYELDQQVYVQTLIADYCGQFRQARRQAWRYWLWCKIKHESSKMLSFTDIRETLKLGSQRDAGIQLVELARIVGSLGKQRDFDRAFNPLNDRTRDRWRRIERACEEGQPLPPLELYQIADSYFVVDGHHRVSVARVCGQEYMEAHIIEFDAPADCLQPWLVSGWNWVKSLSRKNRNISVRKKHDLLTTPKALTSVGT